MVFGGDLQVGSSADVASGTMDSIAIYAQGDGPMDSISRIIDFGASNRENLRVAAQPYSAPRGSSRAKDGVCGR